jgi:LacI family transcriptional regulator
MRMKRRPKTHGQRNILILMEWYDHRIRQGIGLYAREHGWHLTVDERSAVPRDWQGDGVLTVFHTRRDIVAFLRKLPVPAVDLGLYRPDIPIPRVVGDHERIGLMAAEHFADRGFRHAAWFSSAFTPIQRLRLSGFSMGCARHGLPAPQEWVWQRARAASPNDWRRMRLWLEKRLKQAPKPLAVFAHNDYDASKVEDVCRACGLAVPEEVSILGVDDNELICCNQPVPLSSIAHDLARVGYEGAALLDRLIDGARPPAEPTRIPPTAVVLRQSTDLTAVRVPAVRAALSFMRENIGQSLGIAEVASAAGVSRSTLDRLFVLHLNRTVHEELQRIRMAAVKRLLLHSDLPLIDIARQTGFCHAQYLGNLFRRDEGMTPRSYRKRYALAAAVAP